MLTSCYIYQYITCLDGKQKVTDQTVPLGAVWDYFVCTCISFQLCCHLKESNMHVQLPSGAMFLAFGLNLQLLSLFVH